MPNEWFYRIGDRAFGPMSDQKLFQLARAGQLSKASLVRKGVDGIWVRAERIRGLFPSDETGESSPNALPSTDDHTPEWPTQTVMTHPGGTLPVRLLFTWIGLLIVTFIVAIGIRWIPEYAIDPLTIAGTLLWIPLAGAALLRGTILFRNRNGGHVPDPTTRKALTISYGSFVTAYIFCVATLGVLSGLVGFTSAREIISGTPALAGLLLTSLFLQVPFLVIMLPAKFDVALTVVLWELLILTAIVGAVHLVIR